MSEEQEKKLRDLIEGEVGLAPFVLIVDTTELGSDEPTSRMVSDSHSSTYHLIGLLACWLKVLL